jgi:hypothetical protein
MKSRPNNSANCRKWYHRHKKKAIASSKRYYENHKDACLKQRRQYAKRNPRRIAECRIKREYGISLEDYEKRLREQNFECAVCHKPIGKEGMKQQLDHSHETGKIREFLCPLCNRGLGCFVDSILNLESAIQYLKRHQQ